MLKTQQDCVDSYLENCIMEITDTVASDESQKEIREMSIKINDIAYNMEKK